jgi:hypothetical protein
MTLRLHLVSHPFGPLPNLREEIQRHAALRSRLSNRTEWSAGPEPNEVDEQK